MSRQRGRLGCSTRGDPQRRLARPRRQGRRPLRLEISLCVAKDGEKQGELILTIQDNGVGIDAAKPAPNRGGSGNGLALHSTLLAMVGGYLTIESPAEGGTLMSITVPH